MDVSVIFPTRNEEQSIAKVIKRCRESLERLGLTYEIIVVDCSTDNTPKIAESMGAKVLKNVKGYGKACIEGIKLARGKYIVLADADGSYDLSEVDKLLIPLMNDEADVVLGSRFKGKIKPGAMPALHKYIGNPLLTWIMNRLFGLSITDSQTGMRAFKKDVLNQIKLVCPGMEFASEFLIKAARKKMRIAEVPINYYPRLGKSKLRSFRDGWRHLRFMLLNSPTTTFIIPGSLLALLGFALMLYVLLFNPIRYHTQILGCMLVILGVQAVFFGISVKMYLAGAGLIEQDKITNFFSRYSILEEGLIAGTVMILSGLVLGYYILKRWIEIKFGHLNFINLAIVVLVLIVLGAIIMLNVFFISSINMLFAGEEE